MIIRCFFICDLTHARMCRQSTTCCHGFQNRYNDGDKSARTSCSNGTTKISNIIEVVNNIQKYPYFRKNKVTQLANIPKQNQDTESTFLVQV